MILLIDYKSSVLTDDQLQMVISMAGNRKHYDQLATKLWKRFVETVQKDEDHKYLVENEKNDNSLNNLHPINHLRKEFLFYKCGGTKEPPKGNIINRTMIRVILTW